ncbi:MAG TPA: glycerophosphoryl diester phosphodiesterase membrane domain-containing protein [Sphingomicrobium sp.]|nr:glycerophosphoryl diester phosphodiesterase membrane domain-containing protein [Sphingomicrobium sp.]
MASKLSISRAWDETREIFRRDGGLLISVALALIVLPAIVVGIVAPPEPGMQASGTDQILRLVSALIAIVGQLALIRLALGPSTTVGDAIAHGARRFLPAFGAILILILIMAIVIIPLMAILGLAMGIDPSQMAAGAKPGPQIGLLILIMCLVAIAISVRFTLLSPIASGEAIGPLAIIKRCWVLTKGHYWRILGLVVLLLVAAIFLLMTAGVLGGLLARLVSSDIEPFSVAALIVSLVAGVAQGAFSVLASVMLARVYAQLAGAGAEATVPSSGT